MGGWIAPSAPSPASQMRQNRPQATIISTLDNNKHPRRWTVIVSGLLCGVLALVVIYTNRGGLSSPLAIVVLAAVGLLALILQLRLRTGEQRTTVHAPVWLNVVGILFALAALGADLKRIRPDLAPLLALLAVACFAISSVIVLQGLRHREPQPSHPEADAASSSTPGSR